MNSSIQITQVFWLLLIFAGCATTSLLLCGVAKTLFPRFRSNERKPGTHRTDIPVQGREVRSIELPLVGGPALILAIIGTSIGAGYIFHLDQDQWTILIIGLAATFGFGIVGFIDDWCKVFRNHGISEGQKFIGVFLVSITAAICYFFLLPAGRQSYSFWKDLPILSNLLCATHTPAPICAVAFPQAAYFGWFIFFVMMTGITGTATAVSVDFSDGFDGLAGGLVFSAALALAIAVIGLIGVSPSGTVINPGGIVLEILALACAGGVLGFLPWNWPSSWAARRNTTVKRRARLYMGDCGALGLGGLLAMIAIFSRNEFLLLTTIGGVFVIEMLSVVVSTRIFTPFFRRRLHVLRFSDGATFVPHTEFPLPFLAAPLHHHFDLLGWDRKRIVYGAWTLGAIFAFLSVMVSIDDITWQRYLGRFLALILMAAVWSSGTWSKGYFVGKQPNERMRHRRLALYYGYPYKVMGIALYHHVESIEASEDVIETPAEEMALWQRMTIFDARAMLGLYCYRANYYPAAHAQWNRIPEKNRNLRPEIVRLLTDVENRLALEKQETQPIKLDEILHKQEPILTGNLPPADLPNPYEPIRKEEVDNGDKSPWRDLIVPDENNQRTQPLQ